jgi:catechol 2,3-dioxygenase-like lactoylglutathione lyase family enzyme
MSEIIEQLVNRFAGGQLTRRELVVSLSALVLARSEAAAQPNPTQIPVHTLNHVTLSVSDVQRSVEFYQKVFGMPLVTTQGTEADWSAPTVPVLGIGEGPQFIAFSRGTTPSINHYCLGMHGFDADATVETLAGHGIEARVRQRADSDPPAQELMFNDPDGIAVQIQDVSYCGGSGVQGDLCEPGDRPR